VVIERSDPDRVEEADAPADGRPSRITRVRGRVERRAEGALAWLERRREEAVPLDLAVRFYERDRDSFASVLGAAIALRLFLFLIPAMATAVGLLVVVRGRDAVGDITTSTNIAGTFADQLQDTLPTGRSAGWGLLLTGLVLTFWAGRSLTKVLASCAAGAWGLGGRAARATFRMAAAVTTLVVLIFVVSSLLNRLRSAQGIAVATGSWVFAGLAFAAGWFAVSWTLPRGTRDPGALLPGAAVVGVAMASLQWFMQFYLPGRIDRASEFAGNLGWTIATLGYMFLIGRLMASSLILNATVWERLGSVSTLLFALPVLSRVPERFPSVGHFFDLERTGTPEGVEPEEGGGDGAGGTAPSAAQSATETDSTS
jgi:hypothetical protein